MSDAGFRSSTVSSIFDAGTFDHAGVALSTAGLFLGCRAALVHSTGSPKQGIEKPNRRLQQVGLGLRLGCCYNDKRAGSWVLSLL